MKNVKINLDKIILNCGKNCDQWHCIILAIICKVIVFNMFIWSIVLALYAVKNIFT